MKKVVIALVCLVVLNGCGAHAAKKQFYAMTGTFEAAQIAMEARVKQPHVTEEEKAVLKQYSEAGTGALKAAKFYLDNNEKDELSQQMALLQGLVVYIRYKLYPPTVQQEVPVPVVGQE